MDQPGLGDCFSSFKVCLNKVISSCDWTKTLLSVKFLKSMSQFHLNLLSWAFILCHIFLLMFLWMEKLLKKMIWKPFRSIICGFIFLWKIYQRFSEDLFYSDDLQKMHMIISYILKLLLAKGNEVKKGFVWGNEPSRTIICTPPPPFCWGELEMISVFRGGC